MLEPVTAIISGTALFVSVATAWLTFFRRGTVRMTQPTVIFFGPDGGTHARPPRAKIFLRTLLFSTGKRGWVVESVHIRISRGETRQNFNIWVYGDGDKLVRGSGLFVGETGVATNHHFLLPEDAPPFSFLPGTYIVEVFAKPLGSRQLMLFSQALEVTHTLSTALENPHAGLYFDWGPDSARYYPHVDIRAERQNADRMFDFLANVIPPELRDDAKSNT